MSKYGRLEAMVDELAEVGTCQSLYENVLNTILSLENASAKPESIVLLGAVANASQDRTMVHIQWEAPNGGIAEDCFWKDRFGSKVGNKFGKSNFTGNRGEGREPEKRVELDLDKIERAKEAESYVPTIFEVETC